MRVLLRTAAALGACLLLAGWMPPGARAQRRELGISEAIQQLRDRDWEFRAEAARALAEKGPSAKGAIAPLVRALEDDHAKVRGTAAWALREIDPSNPAIVAPLTKAVKDPDYEVRMNVVMALGAVGPEGVPGLIVAMEDEAPLIRSRAAVALGQMGGLAKAAAPALRVGAKDPDADVRTWSEWALNKVDPPPPVPSASKPKLIAPGSSKPEPPPEPVAPPTEVAEAEAPRSGGSGAAWMVGGGVLVVLVGLFLVARSQGWIGGGDDEEDEELADEEFVARHASTIVRPPSGIAASPPPQPGTDPGFAPTRVIPRAGPEPVHGGGGFSPGPDAYEPLSDNLPDLGSGPLIGGPDLGGVDPAGGSAGGDVRETRFKIERFSDREVPEQGVAGGGLAADGSIPLPESGGGGMQIERFSDRKESALPGGVSAGPGGVGMAPGAGGDQSKIEKLLGELMGGDEDARFFASAELAKQGRAAVAGLVEALNHSDPDIRYWAAVALDEIGADADAARPALFDVLKDSEESSEVRALIGGALAKMGGTALEELEDLLRMGVVDARCQAASALGKVPAELFNPVQLLAEALGDQDETVRFAAVNALADLGPGRAQSAVPAIQRLAHDPDPGVREAVTRALKRFEPKQG